MRESPGALWRARAGRRRCCCSAGWLSRRFSSALLMVGSLGLVAMRRLFAKRGSSACLLHYIAGGCFVQSWQTISAARKWDGKKSADPFFSLCS